MDVSLLRHEPCRCWDWTIVSLISPSLHLPFLSTFYLLPCLLFDHWAFQTRLWYQLNTVIQTLCNAYYVPDTALALELQTRSCTERSGNSMSSDTSCDSQGVQLDVTVNLPVSATWQCLFLVHGIIQCRQTQGFCTSKSVRKPGSHYCHFLILLWITVLMTSTWGKEASLEDQQECLGDAHKWQKFISTKIYFSIDQWDGPIWSVRGIILP